MSVISSALENVSNMEMASFAFIIFSPFTLVPFKLRIVLATQLTLSVYEMPLLLDYSIR